MSDLFDTVRQAPAARESHIQRLSDDVLRQIFLLVPQGSRSFRGISVVVPWRNIVLICNRIAKRFPVTS